MASSTDPDQMPQNSVSDQVSTVCKYFSLFSHFSLEISKSHSLIYLKLKLDSSSILCGPSLFSLKQVKEVLSVFLVKA